MKRILLFLLALGTFLALSALTTELMAQGGVQPVQTSANPAPANQAPANKPPIPVVVVDYIYLMDIHPQLYADMNVLNQQFKQTSELVRKDLETWQNMQRELEGITPGTTEYSTKMEAARKFKADVELRAIKDQEDFQMKELNITYRAFQEIKGMIDQYAKKNNILVVINHVDIVRRLPAEKTAETKNVELSQIPTVIWVNPIYDITTAIENWLNEFYVPKGYEAVNYPQLIEQKFGARTRNTGTQTPTNVALPNNQPLPR